ncbi:GAF and HD-GYP domain-containing protein [Corallococcus macrosporus]|uniref:GAF domain-containing protein n=1 Tax=Myxococcus fulvus (strain ATCC BAA-855 / HW-1) TaxID=483219 RepID=F8CFS9_MYXFH|nr:HD family phosphohydrolase [Corallococcus macrosporus]AEI64898.1 GAF domain-containing protein [Corallococcus macrosporus]
MLAHPAPQPELTRRLAKLTSILDVAKAMSAERDLDLLLPLILFEATKVVEADRCSLFILDRERNELWSKVAQGSKSEIRLPVGSGVAGQVAQTGAVINIPDAYADARFNRSFDVSSGYQTKTILCVPMRDAGGEVTGVIQALNKLDGASFNAEDEELLLALGAQAAGAIENALLHEDINRLFEGFVSASVVAIESRDPTTAGHSGRVADLTVAMAQALEHLSTGPYAHTRFSAGEIQELRYASLLHDFGKVGVREPVLVKAEKLYPHELEGLRARFELARKDLQLQSYRRRIAAVKVRGQANLAEIEAEEEERLAREVWQLDEVLEFILSCNRPTVLAQGNFERLHELGALRFLDAHDQAQPLLLPGEIQSLSIARGTLSPEERREIESHVEHTYRFLSQIPWTRTLRRVPEIAYAHHEKLDGTGYPRAEKDIPVQSRMMSICDIYDALTASDRPYKKAVPHALALDILRRESDAGQLDPALYTVFIEADIPRKVLQGVK